MTMPLLLSTVVTFLKSMFTDKAAILVPMLLIILFIVFNNLDTITTGLGIETKSALREKIVQLELHNQALRISNSALLEEVKNLERNTEKVNRVMSEYVEEVDVIKTETNKIEENRKKLINEIKTEQLKPDKEKVQPKVTTQVAQSTIKVTSSLSARDRISKVNIESIWQSYNEAIEAG